MADEPQTIRAIHWREVFPFLHIFRAFRVAVHPSKLVLGLAALLTIYAGGRILDGLWPDSASPIVGELELYEAYSASPNPGGPFREGIEQIRATREQRYARELQSANLVKEENKALEAARNGDYYKELKTRVMEDRDKAVRTADEDRQKRDKATDDNKDFDAARKAREHAQVKADYEEAVGSAFTRAHREIRRLQRLRPRGVFAEFFDYELRQVNNAVYGVMANNWPRGAATAAELQQQARRVVEDRDQEFDASVGAVGVFPAVRNFFTVGPAWLFRYHLLYGILFTILFLLVWAVFGGAICRIAAVHVARDEKISVRQALRFSISKVLSFVFAPVIPLLIVLGIGVVLAIGGLLFYVPWVGPIAAWLLIMLSFGLLLDVGTAWFERAGGTGGLQDHRQ